MAKQKKPCKNCPFRRENGWYGGYATGQSSAAKILAFQETDRQQIFSCHELHPDANVFSLKDMQVNDCSGFMMMKENMATPGTHAGIVNYFNETGPESFCLKYWADKEGFKPQSNLLQ